MSIFLMDVQWANFWVNLGLAIITLLAVLVALFQQKFWDWWNSPIVKIGFGNEEPYALDSYPRGMINLLFRLKIVNLGETVGELLSPKELRFLAKLS